MKVLFCLDIGAQKRLSFQAFYALYLPQLALAVSIPAAILAFVFPISWAAGGLLLLGLTLIFQPVAVFLRSYGAHWTIASVRLRSGTRR